MIAAGVRVARDTALQLMDTMPDDAPDEPDSHGRRLQVAGVRGVEKCFARKTGLRYHVDLHLEVDPDLTVRQSHEIAHDVREHVTESWIGWRTCWSTSNPGTQTGSRDKTPARQAVNRPAICQFENTGAIHKESTYSPNGYRFTDRPN